MAHRFRAAFPAPAPLPAIAVNLAAVTYFLLTFSRHGIGFGVNHLDLHVYRIGSQVWLHGGRLYGPLPGTKLLFTYPPMAAVLLSPLTAVPAAVSGTTVTLGSIALIGVVLWVFTRSLPPGSEFRYWFWWLPPLAMVLEPVRSTLGFGQVNIALMALVSLDCLHPAPRWKRGMLTGLAAAVKLTPAAFILFFLLRGDRRAAATSALSFTAITATGFALDWHDSARYWTSAVFDTSRPGGPLFISNQSLQGVIARAGLDPGTLAGATVWLALSAAVVITAVIGMRRALAAGEPSWALSLNAFAALLVCPISWTHHWVWAAPALLVLADLSGRRGWRAGLAACCGALAIFTVSPPALLGQYGGAGTYRIPWELAAGDSYAIVAVATLIMSVRLPVASRETALAPVEAPRSRVGLRN